jgi:hypothetical protein
VAHPRGLRRDGDQKVHEERHDARDANQGVAAQVGNCKQFFKHYVTFEFQVLSSRRFQREFDRVNLHRHTKGCEMLSKLITTSAMNNPKIGTRE